MKDLTRAEAETVRGVIDWIFIVGTWTFAIAAALGWSGALVVAAALGFSWLVFEFVIGVLAQRWFGS